MYTLYKVDKTGAKWLIGFYDDVPSAAGAIEEDKSKHDDNVRYELERDDDD